MNFPWKDWNDATKTEWADKIIDWFKHNYRQFQDKAMEYLLKHIFDIINYGSEQHREKIKELGRRLKDNRALTTHHAHIMQLLELGLESRHSHMFVLPEVKMKNLLERPDYSTLLLAAKNYQIGNYGDAIKIANNIRGCSLSSYIQGQSERKRGGYSQALTYLDEGEESLKDCSRCHLNKSPICDNELLKAEIYRAKAVVYRKQEEWEKAENFYKEAYKVVSKILEDMQGSISVESGGQDTIKSRAEVVADICYSYGYYWFERKDYNRAKELFNNTIHALKRAEKKWDSPYTRLAIIEFCQNRYKKAMEFFTKAYSLCSETVKENREANLSLALCTLGKKIAAPKVGEVYLDDPIRKLEEAINQKPEFSLGPLECHRDDAQHLSNIDDLPDDTKTLVKNFINLLEEEIKKIRSRSKSIGLLPAKSCDFFISYASEDKEFARSLYDALKKENKSVWFDEAEIKTGDSLRRKIDEGIRKCTYGIVILSPNFIRKRWPQNELDALMAKEGTTNKDVIFPVCYKLSVDELRGYSPLLAGRASMYVKSINEIPKIVSEVLNKFNSSI